MLGMGIAVGVSRLRGGGGGALNAIAALFAAGEKGVWYDPSDLTTLFQDAAGTIPVTAVGQPVGLMLNKAQPVGEQPELVTNGTFDTDTGWVKQTAWTISGGQAVAYSAAIVFDTFSQAYTWTPGKTYRVTFTVTSYVSGAVRFLVKLGGQKGPTCTATGTYSFEFTAASGDEYFGFQNQSGRPEYTIDNLSVKEVGIPGNHASQTISASRPVLQVDANGNYYLNFDGADDYLVTPSIDFTATDKMSVFAGLRNVAGTSYNELVTNGNIATQAGTFCLFTPSNSSTYAIYCKNVGIQQAHSSATYTPPVTNVVTGLVNFSAETGSVLKLRVNGAQVNALGNPDAGNFINAPLTIGEGPNGAGAFNGRLYSLVVRGALCDATELANAETFVNLKTGAY